MPFLYHRTDGVGFDYDAAARYGMMVLKILVLKLLYYKMEVYQEMNFI